MVNNSLEAIEIHPVQVKENPLNFSIYFSPIPLVLGHFIGKFLEWIGVHWGKLHNLVNPYFVSK